MIIPSVTVYIEYRIKAGMGTAPRWQALRARVRHFDSEGPVYGRDLVRPTGHSIEACICECLKQLAPLAEIVRFEFQSEIGMAPREYLDGHLLPLHEKQTSTNITNDNGPGYGVGNRSKSA